MDCHQEVDLFILIKIIKINSSFVQQVLFSLYYFLFGNSYYNNSNIPVSEKLSPLCVVYQRANFLVNQIKRIAPKKTVSVQFLNLMYLLTNHVLIVLDPRIVHWKFFVI